MKRPRIVLADDHTLILTGIRSLLAEQFDIVAAVEDGRTLVCESLRLRPDLIILDVAMPLLNGIEAARQIRAAWPEAVLLFLTMHDDPLYLREAIQAGASGYLLKTSANEELVNAVERVLAGERVLAKAVPGEVRASIHTATGRLTRSTGLTKRQKEVLQLLAEGKSNKEIAQILGISVKTVEFHRAQMMRSLGVHTVAELTRAAVRIGLVHH
jgi:DNA-binding NarL/FixJ family response regulator